MKKVVTVIVLILALMICGACNSPPEIDDLKSQTAALEQLIATQQGLIDSQQGLIDGLKTQIEEFQNKFGENDQSIISMREKIDELQKRNDLYKAQLRNLTGVPIEYTAEKPEYITDGSGETVVVYQNEPGYSTPFLDFLEYNKENRPFGDKKVYVLRPNDYEDEGWGMAAGGYRRKYGIYEQDGKLFVRMVMYSVYDEVFGAGYAGEGSLRGGSLNINLTLAPFDPQEIREMRYDTFVMEFGKAADNYNNYINIYLGNFCIGVCYYELNSYISYTGFKDFLYKHFEMM